MNILNTILTILLLIAATVVFAMLIAHFTGQDLRAYPVMASDALIDIAGKTRRISDLAAEYQPSVNIKIANPSPPLLWTWYEAVKTEKGVDLVYYQVWEDEINPDPFIHWLYRGFRSIYFGSPVRDIEYFQISISQTDGAVQKLMFETSPGDNYYVVLSEHVVAQYEKKANDIYDLVRSNRSGVELGKESGIKPIFKGNRVQVLAQTWNHLTRLVLPSDTDLKPLPTELKILTNEEYASYKFVRKSQGDHRTQENPWALRFAGLAYIMLLPGLVYLWIRSKKKK